MSGWLGACFVVAVAVRKENRELKRIFSRVSLFASSFLKHSSNLFQIPSFSPIMEGVLLVKSERYAIVSLCPLRQDLTASFNGQSQPLLFFSLSSLDSFPFILDHRPPEFACDY